MRSFTGISKAVLVVLCEAVISVFYSHQSTSFSKLGFPSINSPRFCVNLCNCVKLQLSRCFSVLGQVCLFPGNRVRLFVRQKTDNDVLYLPTTLYIH